MSRGKFLAGSSEWHPQSFFEVTAIFRQCSALSVYASNLVEVCKIPLPRFWLREVNASFVAEV